MRYTGLNTVQRRAHTHTCTHRNTQMCHTDYSVTLFLIESQPLWCLLSQTNSIHWPSLIIRVGLYQRPLFDTVRVDAL